MNKIVVALTLLLSGASLAQNLSAEEQRQMVEDLKVMKEKIKKIEDAKTNSGGLKKVNYENETAETKEKAPQGASIAPASLTSEQTKQLLQDIEALKTKQSEAQKMLDQLEKEE